MIRRMFIPFFFILEILKKQDKRFTKIDSASMSGNNWMCFYIKDNSGYFFNSFGRALDEVLLNELEKPITYHNNKNQDRKSRFCGTYCLYFCNLLERMNCYNAVLKTYFASIKADFCIWKQFIAKYRN